MVLRLNHILSYFCLLTLVIAWCLVKHRDIFTLSTLTEDTIRISLSSRNFCVSNRLCFKSHLEMETFLFTANALRNEKLSSRRRLRTTPWKRVEVGFQASALDGGEYLASSSICSTSEVGPAGTCWIGNWKVIQTRFGPGDGGKNLPPTQELNPCRLDRRQSILYPGSFASHT